MKFLKKLRGLGLSWLMVLMMLMVSFTGLTGCGSAEGIDKELVGQVVSVAADIAIEELLETDAQVHEQEKTGAVSEQTAVAAEEQVEATVEEQIEAAAKEQVEAAEEKQTEAATGAKTETVATEESLEPAAANLEEDGWYNDKESVALYLHQYGKLPGNFIDKYDAEDLGWQSSKGNLDDVAPGMSIGGNKFGNREGLLPSAKGRTYYECDINYEGGFRGAERIVYSNDGLIYYTGDHYESFELLYTKEGPAE